MFPPILENNGRKKSETTQSHRNQCDNETLFSIRVVWQRFVPLGFLVDWIICDIARHANTQKHQNDAVHQSFSPTIHFIGIQRIINALKIEYDQNSKYSEWKVAYERNGENSMRRMEFVCEAADAILSRPNFVSALWIVCDLSQFHQSDKFPVEIKISVLKSIFHTINHQFVAYCVHFIFDRNCQFRGIFIDSSISLPFTHLLSYHFFHLFHLHHPPTPPLWPAPSHSFASFTIYSSIKLKTRNLIPFGA